MAKAKRLKRQMKNEEYVKKFLNSKKGGNNGENNFNKSNENNINTGWKNKFCRKNKKKL